MTGKRITIIIEDDQTRQTIRVPLATSVEWEVEYEDLSSYDLLEYRPPEVESLSLSFRPMADANGITHYIHNETR